MYLHTFQVILIFLLCGCLISMPSPAMGLGATDTYLCAYILIGNMISSQLCKLIIAWPLTHIDRHIDYNIS